MEKAMSVHKLEDDKRKVVLEPPNMNLWLKYNNFAIAYIFCKRLSSSYFFSSV